MKHTIILVCLLLITKSDLLAQYPPLPENNQMDKAANDRMRKSAEEILLNLESDDISFVQKSVLYGWNLLISYCKVYPDNHQIIRDVFLTRLSYEPVGFCENFKGNFERSFNKGDRLWTIYKQEIDFMCNICDCVNLQKDINLIKTLISIDADDQKHRGSDALLDDKFVQREREVLDSLNLMKVKGIIKFHGYPGRSLVGTEYENIAWKILLNAGEDTIKKYIGLIKQEIKNRNLHPSAYAHMYDRLAMLQGNSQKFGTQVITDISTNEIVIYKYADPDKVNYYRHSSCMEGLKEFPKYNLINGKLFKEGIGK